MTTHKNPTTLPDEHSCRNSIASQNLSTSEMDFHFPVALAPGPRLDGLLKLDEEVDCDSCCETPISSSRSWMNLAFGSSGKRGSRHRGVASAGMWRVAAREVRGWPGSQAGLLDDGDDEAGMKERRSSLPA
jgi:hypothetical protein